MDATFIESQSLYITKLSYEKFLEKYYFDEKTNWKKYYHKTLSDKCNQIKRKIFDDIILSLLDHKEYIISNILDGNIQNNINYPVHIERIVKNISKKNKKSNILPNDILKGNQRLIKSLFVSDKFKKSSSL